MPHIHKHQLNSTQTHHPLFLTNHHSTTTMRVLDKKIQKVLNMKTTQSDIQEALDSFAEYYDTTENTMDSRKNLRYSLEGISCDLTKQFASELSKFYTVRS